MSGPLLDVRDLTVTFPIQPRGAWPWTPPDMLQAVTGASFTLQEGETLGIVGESGSGKSTLARAIIGTVPAASGQVLWEGTDLTAMSREARRRHRAQLQMVFQDPLAALNPRMTVGSIIAEPLRTHRPDTPRGEVRRRVGEAMERVGLLPNLAGRYPHEFSGGQCQRIGIARALILEPRLVVCDEPVSALDVSVQAQVINLLAELKREMGLALIFIAHDIGVVRHISDRILVMYLGRQMERGPSRKVTGEPAHPYTRALLASVPIPDPRAERARARAPLEGELPSPMNPPSGCVFRTRCPQARPDCAEAPPPVVEASPRHKVACPYWNEPTPGRGGAMTTEAPTEAPTEADVEAAERLLGLTHTPAERAQIARSVEGQIAAARARRALALPHDTPGALRFDPRPPGFAMPAPPRTPHAPREPRPLPDPEGIAFAALPDLAAWIRAGALTSRRLTEIHLARIEAHGAQLRCFAALAPERALAEADAMDALTRAGVSLGPLHGLTYGLKDLFDTAGLATEWGAEPFAGRTPARDAHIVRRLRAAGAVLIGKTAVGALAYGDVWSGGTARNPWNPEEGASGSSAGSASAVAAGLCAFAIGTETLGSITSPCQRCGTTGLRPTFGRVSRAGCMALCPSLDKVGPIARGVEDCALVLAALNGPDPEDRGSIDAPFGWDPAAPLEGIRLGCLPQAFAEGATEVDHAALDAARALGMPVIELALPELPYDALLNLLYAEAAAQFEPLTLSGADDALSRQDDEAWPNTFRRARFLSAVDHVQLDRLRYRVMEALGALFREVDVLIGPFATGPMLVASNFTGHPCLHLRAGFLESRSRGRAGLRARRAEAEPEGPLHTVPQGISLWGPLFCEDLPLRVGLALEAALGVADRRPPLGSPPGTP